MGSVTAFSPVRKGFRPVRASAIDVSRVSRELALSTNCHAKKHQCGVKPSPTQAERAATMFTD